MIEKKIKAVKNQKLSDQEKLEQVREEALLTDEERKEHEYYRVSGGWDYNLDTLLEAQLAKCKKEEYNFLDKILHMPFFEFCLLVKERKQSLEKNLKPLIHEYTSINDTWCWDKNKPGWFIRQELP